MSDVTDREDVTAAELQVLEQNWVQANAVLDACLELNGAHRGEGCTDWFCSGPELQNLLTALEFHSAHMVLRAAIERLSPPGGR